MSSKPSSSAAHWRPLRLRWLHAWYATALGYFWLPCEVCGQSWGGHEWKQDGLPSSVPYPDQPGKSHGICPSCTRAGYGYPYEVAAEIWGAAR